MGLRGVRCSQCGKAVHLDKNGMVTRHKLDRADGRLDCQGTGKPPRKAGA